MNKEAIRREMRALRRGLPQAEQKSAARAVFEQLLAYAPYQRARSVMAYMACRGELSLAPVIDDVLARGKTLLLPRCEAPGMMTARRMQSLAQLAPGAYGLIEPGEDCEIVPAEDIDLILVPGTAFDPTGRRLGQGGGYYDRYLAKTRALRVGVCHGFALLERVPAQAHDARMDAVLTPDGIICLGENTSDYRRT